MLNCLPHRHRSLGHRQPDRSHLLHHKKIIHLRVNASFFELEGWPADKRIYCGDFDPNSGGWSNKGRGEVMIKFEGDDQRTKCSLKLLLQHNLTTIPDEDDGDSSSDDPPPSEPRTPEHAPQPATNDPNKTQSFGDSSDEEGARRQQGMCMQPPSLANCAPVLFAHTLRFLHACLLMSYFLPVEDAPGPNAAPWYLLEHAPGAGVAAQPDHGPQPDVPVDDNADPADSSDEETEGLAAARLAYGTKFTKTTKDKSQPAASLVWKLEDATKMPKHCIREKEVGALGTKYGPQLINIPPGENIDSLRKM